jgi:hypothetical protein
MENIERSPKKFHFNEKISSYKKYSRALSQLIKWTKTVAKMPSKFNYTLMWEKHFFIAKNRQWTKKGAFPGDLMYINWNITFYVFTRFRSVVAIFVSFLKNGNNEKSFSRLRSLNLLCRLIEFYARMAFSNFRLFCNIH